MEQMPHRDLHRQEHRHTSRRGRRHDPNDFFGLDIEKMSAKAQITAGLAVIVPAVVAMTLVLTLVPYMFWLIFVFGWAIFPAFGLLLRGIVGLSNGDAAEHPVANGKERELLEALRELGELTPARAAMETSLTVSEADEMLKGLVEGGHLEVRVRGGGLFYALWEPEDASLESGEKI